MAARTYSSFILMLAVAALITAFYVGRMMQLVFFGKPRHEAAEHAHESPPLMTRPLIVLAFLTITGGLLNLPFFTRVWAEAAQNHPSGIWLGLEAWLEHTIQSYGLTEEGLLHLPQTPVVLSPLVASLSLLSSGYRPCRGILYLSQTAERSNRPRSIAAHTSMVVQHPAAEHAVYELFCALV